jgi:hypothetical protein
MNTLLVVGGGFAADTLRFCFIIITPMMRRNKNRATIVGHPAKSLLEILIYTSLRYVGLPPRRIAQGFGRQPRVTSLLEQESLGEIKLLARGYVASQRSGRMSLKANSPHTA